MHVRRAFACWRGTSARARVRWRSRVQLQALTRARSGSRWATPVAAAAAGVKARARRSSYSRSYCYSVGISSAGDAGHVRLSLRLDERAVRIAGGERHARHGHAGVRGVRSGHLHLCLRFVGLKLTLRGLDLKLERLELRRAGGLILMALRHRDREALARPLVKERAVHVHMRVHMRVHVRAVTSRRSVWPDGAGARVRSLAEGTRLR